ISTALLTRSRPSTLPCGRWPFSRYTLRSDDAFLEAWHRTCPLLWGARRRAWNLIRHQTTNTAGVGDWVRLYARNQIINRAQSERYRGRRSVALAKPCELYSCSPMAAGKWLSAL